MTSRAEVDFADVQGLVRFGHGRMTRARYDLLRVKDATAARAWLHSVVDQVATAEKTEVRPTTALQVAFTAPGLRAIGIPESIIEEFSHEFRTGMATEYRSRQLGDVGANAPANWEWGHPASEPHVVVMFFGEDERLDDLVKRSTGTLWEQAFDGQTLDVADLEPTEPFGFADGLSQPEIDWEQLRATQPTQPDYTNLTALGEFLLGYPNEYGKITERPLLELDAGTAGLLEAQEAPHKKDFGRNGTYLVMRQLEQDVRGFWQFVDEQAGGDAGVAERLAAAMVGRTREGEPLVPPDPEASPGGAERNQFTFDDDPSGVSCPFGAHVRRANPRNGDFPERPTSWFKKLRMTLGLASRDFRYDVMSPVRFHRVLRRGRAYGPPLAPDEARTPGPSAEAARGLHFICLNANISRQFEFVQGAWLSSTKFSALTGESDPLLGTREPIPGCPVTSNFNIPQADGMRQRISDIPRFVTLRGGAYFFLPSLRALRYLASENRAEQEGM